MRSFDPTLELVLCGSSSASMPTFGEWERVALTHAYDEVDYISCHAYYEDTGDRGEFLASSVNMDRFIESVVATADHVKAVKGSDKTINISFDEWNIWYNERFENVDKIQGVDNWPVAPRLLEDCYTVTDAVVFGNLLISLLNHADRVTSASMAQLVNVIAPIMTEPGGPSWRQTTFFPFAATSAHARGSALRLNIECDSYPTTTYGEVPLVDAAATFDGTTGNTAVYLVNRSQHEEIEVTIDLGNLPKGELTARTLNSDDANATNTIDHQNRVTLDENPTIRRTGTSVIVVLPPISWTEITIGAE